MQLFSPDNGSVKVSKILNNWYPRKVLRDYMKPFV